MIEDAQQGADDWRGQRSEALTVSGAGRKAFSQVEMRSSQGDVFEELRRSATERLHDEPGRRVLGRVIPWLPAEGRPMLMALRSARSARLARVPNPLRSRRMLR